MGAGGESLRIGRVPALRRWYGAMLTLVVLLAGGTLTWVAARTGLETEKQRARAQLQLLAADTQSAIGDRLLAYEALLRAGVGLLDTFWPIQSDDWQHFTAQMRLATVYPGLQGIGFAARLGNSEQLAVVFIEPLDESNRLALGFDPMSEARRRAALERARDSGSPALSGTPPGGRTISPGVPGPDPPVTPTAAAPELPAGPGSSVAAKRVAAMRPQPEYRPVGLLALTAAICVLGVTIALIRAIVSERAYRTNLA